MSRARIALAASLLLTALAIGVTLLKAPESVLRANGITEESEVAETKQAATICQSHEAIPGGTTAIRVSADAEIGPPVAIVARSGAQIVTSGTRGGGWGVGVVTVPVRRVSRTVPDATVCLTIGAPIEPVIIYGRKTPRAVALVTSKGQPLTGRMGIEFLHADSASWLSAIPSVARRMGLGHAWGGTWIVFALLAAMACAGALASALAAKELR